MKRFATLIVFIVMLFFCTASLAAEPVFAFEQLSYNVFVEKTLELRPIAQGIEGKLKFSWESSDPAVVTVKGGKIKGISIGSASIICTAETQNGDIFSAECEIQVLQPVTKITTKASKLYVPYRVPFKPEIIVEPENANNNEIEWTLPKEDVVYFYKDGSMSAEAVGTIDMIGRAKDGSGKKVKLTLVVPKVYVANDNITIDSPEGVILEYQYNVTGELIGRLQGDAVETESINVGAYYPGLIEKMKLIPKKAGTATYLFGANGNIYAKVKIKVEHSAVYDKVSCPPTTVNKIIDQMSDGQEQKVSLTGELSSIVPLSSSKQRIYAKTAENEYFTFTYEKAQNFISGNKFTVYGLVEGLDEYVTETGLRFDCPNIIVKNLEIE